MIKNRDYIRVHVSRKKRNLIFESASFVSRCLLIRKYFYRDSSLIRINATKNTARATFSK